MTLTISDGPLAPHAPGTVNYEVSGPRQKLLMHPFPRRVRAVFAGEVLADTERGTLLHETSLLPQLYVPEADLRSDLLEPSEHTTHCPYKGDASYRDVRVGGRVAENAVWSYPEPTGDAAWLAGYAAIYFSAMDEWWDEDEQVHGHLRDPYHRVDARSSHKHVLVELDKQVLAESRRPMLLSETGLPNRYYLPREDVRIDLTHTSEARTVCPYKGTSTYLHTADTANVAWSYEHPLPDAAPIASYVCFDPAKATVLVNGTAVS